MIGTLIAIGVAGAATWAAVSKSLSKKKGPRHEKKDFKLSDNQANELKRISDEKIGKKRASRKSKVDESLDKKAEKAAKKRKKSQEYEEGLAEAESKVKAIEEEYLNNIDERYISNSELKFLKKLIEKTYDGLGKYAEDINEKKHVKFFQILGGDFNRNIHNEKFLEYESKIQGKYFEKFDEHGLTDKQLEAVLSDEDAVLVNAGAGTGKTKTIESKVLYLHNIKKIPLDEILVITFAKKSQKDMMKRIIESLKKSGVNVTEDDLADTVSTFHAFGKRILDEYDEKHGKVYEPEKEIGKGKVGRKVVTVEDEGNPLGQIVKKILDEMKTGDIKDELIQYLTYFARPELQVYDYDSRGQYYEQAKKTYLSLLKKPENGFSYNVKSYGELMIANYFAMHGIDALYEPKDFFYTQLKKNLKI